MDPSQTTATPQHRASTTRRTRSVARRKHGHKSGDIKDATRRSLRRAVRDAAAINPAAQAQRASKMGTQPDHRVGAGSGQRTSVSGKQFMVGNIGGGGRIYLRPVVRPGNQRLQPVPSSAPTFGPPPDTPPDSAKEVESVFPLRHRPLSPIDTESVLSDTTAPPSRPVRQLSVRGLRAAKRSAETLGQSLTHQEEQRATKHTRSASDSTIKGVPQVDQGDIKVVIRQTSSASKEGPNQVLSLLEVPIPSYRLGTPQFGAEGNATLRSSLYTRTGSEYQSSNASNAGYSKLVRSPSEQRPSLLSDQSSATMQSPFLRKKSALEVMDEQTPVVSPYEPRYSIVAVANYLYDFLSARPDDPSVVRYAPNSDVIIAATPSRLIAHITSPSFLDYDLLSDFFLTFRFFLRPDELASFLVSRLRWAVERPDDFGRIVRVRTFVALRHWILNYFMDDFLENQNLRRHFCELVNKVYNDLKEREDGGAGDRKIIGGLKKCWWRSLGMYWAIERRSGREEMDDDIQAGGKWSASAAEGMAEAGAVRDHNVVAEAGNTAEERPQTAIKDRQQPRATPSPLQHTRSASTPEALPPILQNATEIKEKNELYEVPSTETTPKINSCSIPMNPTLKFGRTPPAYRGPHPIPTLPADPTKSTTPSVARPICLPIHIPKSSGGSEKCNDSHQPSETSKEDLAHWEAASAIIIPGSLVRGVLYQPGSPYFEVSVPGSQSHRKTVSAGFEETDDSQQMKLGQPLSGGMTMRWFGTFKKSLGSKHGTNGEPHSPSLDRNSMPWEATQSRTTDSIFEERQREQITRRKSSNKLRTHVRIDLLSAKVSETYQAAVQTGMEKKEVLEAGIVAYQDEVAQSNTHIQTLKAFDRSVTMGSRSIVIVDDTQPEAPVMSGANRPTSATPSAVPSDATQEFYEKTAREASRIWLEERRSANSEKLRKQKSSSGLFRFPSVYLPSGIRRSKSHMGGSLRTAGSSELNKSTDSSQEGSGFKKLASYQSMVGQHQYGASPKDSDDFVLGKPPSRQLRRRPGGDLKAVEKVHDLIMPARHRRNSTGSSVVSSIALVASDTPSLLRTAAVNSITIVTPEQMTSGVDSKAEEPPKRKSISLIQTHSSQPNLRPSFEAEVAKLAALPDDTDDDGGIDVALLKLEGKYEKKTPSSSPAVQDFPPETTVEPKEKQEPISDESKKYRHHKERIQDILTPATVSPSRVQTKSIYHTSQSSGLLSPALQHEKRMHSSAASEESYSSTPLLQRGISSVVAPGLSPLKLAQIGASPRLSRSHATISKEELRESIRLATSADPDCTVTVTESFLLDESEAEKPDHDPFDLSTHSDEDSNETTRNKLDDNPLPQAGRGPFMHPLRQPDTPPTGSKAQYPNETTATMFSQGLPTPGLTPVGLNQTCPLSPLSLRHPQNAAESGPQPVQVRIKTPSVPPVVPPTPGVETPSSMPVGCHQVTPGTIPSSAKPGSFPQANVIKNMQSASLPPGMPTTAHLPFILAYSPDQLASQFTLIEKDALDSLDWRDLIEMRWSQASPVVTDWVTYLREEDPRGVDLVIARFNLVVRWVVSEVVLTHDPSERAHCITAYIRIAEACRKMRNFATCYQIVVALLSADIAGLNRSWSLVPEREKKALRELEELVQPTRNFLNLRREMEGVYQERGCIPFIGIYTRDLVYNAQKPLFVSEGPASGEHPAGPVNGKDRALVGKEPLVNFERCRVAAGIVKGLLRLLEGSSRYEVRIEEQLMSRCLWLGALGEEELKERVAKLE